MTSNNNMKYVFIALWLAILAYLISLMVDICEPRIEDKPVSTTSGTTTTSAESFNNSDNTFDYTENFEPNNPVDAADSAAPKNQVANQVVNFKPTLDNSDVLVKNVTQEEDDELVVEGTDALIAASSDRFYSIDTKGQTNRNASNDLRGDLPIAYNANYTPFNQSAIYGEPLVPAGRL
jgi:hypothetical protein